MNYAVVWLPRAQVDLADAWNNAGDRNAVTVADNEIERLLETDPLNQGESRGAKRRIVFERPLVAVYRVDRRQRRAIIGTVSLTGPRR